MCTYRGVNILVGAFSVNVKTGCGTDGALHSSLHFIRTLEQCGGLSRSRGLGGILHLLFPWPSPTGDPANKANPGLI